MTRLRLKQLFELAKAHRVGIQAIHDEIAKEGDIGFEEAALAATSGLATLIDCLDYALSSSQNPTPKTQHPAKP